MKKVLRLTFLVITALIAYLLYNVAVFSGKQGEPVAAAATVDFGAAAGRLAGALRIPTVSLDKNAPVDSSAFHRFGRFLEENYPLTHSRLEMRTFNTFSRLYRWRGTDSSRQPVVLAAHYDVVPVPEESRPLWHHPPFSGLIKNDTLWGRGAIDDKINIIAIMEAVERMLADGFQPARDIWLAFGHDEEIEGTRGAAVMSAWLKERGVRAGWVLDEGYAVVRDMIPGMTGPVAIIGTAEKGYATIRLSVSITGGHSSMPEKETALDVMAGAIKRLKENPLPARLSAPVRDFMRHIGPEMPFAQRLVFANAALFEDVIINIYSARGSGNAMVRTTTAPTIFRAGIKENIIPQFAEATVNFRLLPGETRESLMAHVTEVLNDPRVKALLTSFNPASPVSSTDGTGFNIIRASIKAVYHNPPVAPNLVIGGTDGRYYHAVSDDVYRFSPIRLDPRSVKRFHGINESIPLSDIDEACHFYLELIRRGAGTTP